VNSIGLAGFLASECPTVFNMRAVTELCFSGGNKVEVRGLNLLYIQKPQFIVYINDENRTAV